MSGKKVQQIEDDLREKIQTGVLAQGMMLPGRQKLAQEYGVALSTLERAISALLADGLLRADNGRGTFVHALSEPASHPQNAGTRSKPERTLAGATLGIVVAMPDHYRERILAEQIEQAFSEWGGTTVTATGWQGSRTPEGHSLARPEGLYEAGRQLLRQGVDALILIGYHADHTRLGQVALRLEAERAIPIAAIASLPMEGTTLTHVYYDNEEAGEQAAEYILRHSTGEEPIYFIAPFSSAWATYRESGVRNVVARLQRKNAIRFWPEERENLRNASQMSNQEAGFEAFQTLRNTVRLFTPAEYGYPAESVPRLIAVSDNVAHGIRIAAEKNGLRVGVDFALMGIGDSERSQEMGLTSLRPPLEEMAREAVRLVRMPLLGKFLPLPERAVRLKMHLVRRTSTRLIDGIGPLR